MLFLHVLLFFILGTFTVAAPVPEAPANMAPVPADNAASFSPKGAAHDAAPAPGIKLMGGYWVSTVSEHYSFSDMDLIYLDRSVRENRILI